MVAAGTSMKMPDTSCPHGTEAEITGDVPVSTAHCWCHVQVDLPASSGSRLETLFAEELGLVVEAHPDHLQAVQDAYRQAMASGTPP